MQTLKAIHRIAMLVVVTFTLYLALTGTGIQLMDLKSLLTHVPASDGNIRAMREGFSGPPNFQVIRPTDYTAPSMPGLSNPSTALTPVLSTARQQLQGRSIDFLELRATDGQPTAYVRSKKDVLAFDVASGRFLGASAALPPEKAPADALRNRLKVWHKFLEFGRWALAINFVVLASLVTLIITGLWLYWKLYSGRRKLDRKAPFWSAGGFWREFHRHVSLVATVFILVVVVTGSEISFETLYRVAYEKSHPKMLPTGQTEFVDGREGDKSSPITDAEAPAMLQTVTTSYRSAMPNVPMRAVRLRYFAGIPQGVVITGEAEPEQLVFNAKTGAQMGQTEPSYPPTGFPFGWRIHQLAKNIHRGDLIGLPGRFMSLLAGLSLIYLSVSGAVMYWQMWKKRRSAGRKGLVWL